MKPSDCIDDALPLGIAQNGMARRLDDGGVEVCRVDSLRRVERIAVPKDLADHLHLEVGDVVAGTAADGELLSIETVNRLPAHVATVRPRARERGPLERTAPERLLSLGASGDLTGRLLDMVAPLPIGCAGLVYGPHGSGMTRILQTVAQAAVRTNLLTIVLLARPRTEEVTDWRRRLPQAEVVALPSSGEETDSAAEAMLAMLVLACAQRQTELGLHVALIVDSLTGVWAAMLESEQADAQAEADRAGARLQVMQWLQAAGWFGGEGFLGSGLGGSLTVVASAWHAETHPDAEEEREVHPHLRLLEHALGGLGWRAPLSAALADRRRYPAIDPVACWSAGMGILDPSDRTAQDLALAGLATLPLEGRHAAVLDALDRHASVRSAVQALATHAPPQSSRLAEAQRALFGPSEADNTSTEAAG